jgi:hypothetical protein
MLHRKFGEDGDNRGVKRLSRAPSTSKTLATRYPRNQDSHGKTPVNARAQNTMPDEGPIACGL